MTLPNEARKAVADQLARLLADTYTLATKTHGYHWNVVGEQFVSLHALFDEQYSALYEAADEVAERIRALGELAPSSHATFAKLASIKLDDKAPAAKKMIEALRDAHLKAADTARKVVRVAEAQEDSKSADLATDRIGEHEKAAWMLGALLG